MRPMTTPLWGRRALKVAAVLTAGVFALTGCSSAVNSSKSSSGNGEPVAGGTLKIGTTVDLNPPAVFTNSNATINTLIGAVYDSLVDINGESTTPEPALAESWELAPDGLSLTLHLRKGVKFHSGRDLTSDDVAFSIKTWADPKWTVQFQRTAAAITDVDTSDPHTAVLKFAKPASNIFDLLDVLPIIDKDTFADLQAGKKYVGTGPFEFVSWTPQSKLVFKKNPDYWGGDVKLDGVEVDIVPNAQSLVSQLRSGQLDTAIGVAGRDIDTLVKDGKFQAIDFKGAEGQFYVGANVANPAVADVRLRQAIAYALDRERIVKEVFRGNGYPIVAPWPKYSLAYDEKVNDQYSFDLDKAKALVKEIGDVPTLPLEYSTGDPAFEAMAQIVQSDLEKVGVKVELKPEENATFVDKLINGTYDALWVNAHAYAQWTPSTLSVTAYPFNANKNSSNFVDEKYKKDADAAWATPDGASDEAKELYADVTSDLVDNLFLIESNVYWTRVVASDKVHDVAWSKRQELHLQDTWLG